MTVPSKGPGRTVGKPGERDGSELLSALWFRNCLWLLPSFFLQVAEKVQRLIEVCTCRGPGEWQEEKGGRVGGSGAGGSPGLITEVSLLLPVL